MNNPIGREKENANNKPLETDSAEIVRRHLEDKNHEITDDDIRNVRIAVEDDEPVTTGAEAQAKFVENDMEDDKEEENEVPDPNDKPATPWDVIN